MLKTTSIASVIGLIELTGAAEQYGSVSFSIFELLIVSTVYYLLLTTIWGYIQGWIEKRLDPNRTLKSEINQKELRELDAWIWYIEDRQWCWYISERTLEREGSAMSDTLDTLPVGYRGENGLEMVRAEKIVKRFGDLTVLNGVDLSG